MWRLALLCAATAEAATDSQPHYHRGKLTPYKVGPPSVLLSSRDEQCLRSGKPVMQALVAEDGVTRRMIMVQDIPVPSSIVLGCATPPPRLRERLCGHRCSFRLCSLPSGLPRPVAAHPTLETGCEAIGAADPLARIATGGSWT